MIRNKVRTKISLQLLLAIGISFIASFFVWIVIAYYISWDMTNVRSFSPTFYNTVLLFIFLICIGIFIFTFLMLINKKIRYLRYLSGRVKEIAHEKFGSVIEIRGNDEISELCMSINSMSRELKHKLEHERDVERSKNELISGISHDLRTPLTSIKGYLQLLKDEQYETPEQLSSYVDVAFSKTEMLESLVDDLFEFTRLTGKEVKLECQRLCLNDIIYQLVLDYGPLFQKENLFLQASIPDEKFFVRIDPDKFVRVIENLFGNALKYSHKPGDVLISLYPDTQGVKMTIKNHGEAIEPENLSHLFDRFYRLEKSRSKETGGAGLGLAIAKSIVELHCGKIWAESQKETIYFNVWLPLD
ncbi:HAMP domain-containing sensor histidine kinase [Desulfitobacterium sp.]|uniref:sensor histidine kinase n=1 Tax=Desulfitobacterium sp. TaxID=49981 RepID=UPI002B1F92F8|nr:HAMP domain-containing sensor histidine kinase [Desulfitobacterium sp.]MEA4902626.1 HAMP domain-containing sensor histidine kinase [Desulfitobacterium sp.]